MTEWLPDYDDFNGWSSVVCRSGAFFVYMNGDAARDLLRGIWGLATDFALGEEVDIWSDGHEGIEGDPIGLCEIHVHRKEDILQTVRFSPLYDRLDLYVTREECKAAFHDLMRILDSRSGILFEHIHILVGEDYSESSDGTR